jgi:hypothetical protein
MIVSPNTKTTPTPEVHIETPHKRERLEHQRSHEYLLLANEVQKNNH